MTELLGAWSLVSCIHYRDDEATPAYGDPPSGQIQYTADGRMSAFLMDPAWAARGKPAADSRTEFFAYAGTWRLEGDEVTHEVLFCSHPGSIGARFVRRLTVLDDDRIELLTAPEVSTSGRTHVSRLVWQRCGR
jgi:hypothetical protein